MQGASGGSYLSPARLIGNERNYAQVYQNGPYNQGLVAHRDGNITKTAGNSLEMRNTRQSNMRGAGKQVMMKQPHRQLDAVARDLLEFDKQFK